MYRAAYAYRFGCLMLVYLAYLGRMAWHLSKALAQNPRSLTSVQGSSDVRPLLWRRDRQMEENRKSTATRNAKRPTVTPEDIELGKRLRAIREAKGYSYGIGRQAYGH